MTEPRESQNGIRGSVTYFIVALAAAAFSVMLYAGGQYLYQTLSDKKPAALQTAIDNPASADTKAAPQPTGDGTAQLRKSSEGFRSVAKKVGPAVVNITAKKGAPKKTKPRMGRRRQAPDEEGEGGNPQDPFFEFFERFGMPFGGQPFPMQETPQTSFGSGFIIDKKGLVVTNHHVVEGASEIFVKIVGERKELKAKLIGSDSRTDLAVIKIEGQKDLPIAEWADSDAVEVGDWAIAIGSPFNLDHSVTVGIVSAKNRNAQGLGNEFGGELIQTDAAINPGNSGGPLCDIDGKVMGVNQMIYTRSGGYMGIGLAIPSNLAKAVMVKLVEHGKVVRGWLGVYIQPLDPELASELGVKDGVAVQESVEGSPAEKAGIAAGDVIIEVDGKAVTNVTELQNKISNYKPGETVKIKVISYDAKKQKTVNVKIGELPKETESRNSPQEGGADDEPDKLGLVVGAKGREVVIKGIEPGSLAEMGLEVGDVIVRINRQAVTSVSQYKKIVESSKKFYLFEVKRKGRTLVFTLKVPE
jgi:serine protease Do